MQGPVADEAGACRVGVIEPDGTTGVQASDKVTLRIARRPTSGQCRNHLSLLTLREDRLCGILMREGVTNANKSIQDFRRFCPHVGHRHAVSSPQMSRSPAIMLLRLSPRRLRRREFNSIVTSRQIPEVTSHHVANRIRVRCLHLLPHRVGQRLDNPRASTLLRESVQRKTLSRLLHRPHCCSHDSPVERRLPCVGPGSAHAPRCGMRGPARRTRGRPLHSLGCNLKQIGHRPEGDFDAIKRRLERVSGHGA